MHGVCCFWSWCSWKLSHWVLQTTLACWYCKSCCDHTSDCWISGSLYPNLDFVGVYVPSFSMFWPCVFLLYDQVFAQTIFAMNEKSLATRWQAHGSFFNKIYTVRLQCIQDYSFQFTPSRLLLRTGFVIFTTLVAMMFPFFNAILGLLGSISFWPLTVYFPLNMYMVQANIKRGDSTWIMFQVLSLLCLVVSLVSAIGSVADMLERLKHAQLFHINL